MASFIRNNIVYIIVFVVLLISILTMFTVLGIDFNPHRHEHIEKIVTIESFGDGVLEKEGEDEEDNVYASARGDTMARDGIFDTSLAPDNRSLQPGPKKPNWDSSEETGSSVLTTSDKKTGEFVDNKKNTEKNFISRLKKRKEPFKTANQLKRANKDFLETLADNKGLNSHCHAKFGDQNSAEEHCNKIKRAQGCAANNCCVWLFNETEPKCVSGSSSGPVYLTRNGKDLDNSKFYYQGKCNGSGC